MVCAGAAALCQSNRDQLLLDLGGFKADRRQLQDNRRSWEERWQTIESALERKPERSRCRSRSTLRTRRYVSRARPGNVRPLVIRTKPAGAAAPSFRMG